MTRERRAIGVFDSGVGGLSVLRALRSALPEERFVYLADSANAPYGERGDAYVSARSQAIAGYLRERHRIKALVLACNTATAAAIDAMRSRHPDLPLIGLEPAIKPALTATQTGYVGVIGTRGTLSSARFGKLLAALADQARHRVRFVVQACDGLAQAIESSVSRALPAPNEAPDASETGALCQRYTEAMGAFGKAPGQIDTLVLGCTHYVFVAHELRALLGPEVRLIETGEAVARQTRRLLEATGLLDRPAQAISDGAAAEQADAAPETPRIRLLSTGPAAMLQAAAQRWLSLPASCCETVPVP